MSNNLLPQDTQGSLERLGLSVETPIDESILTQAAARTVRFRSVKIPGRAKPAGYAFGEVDKFVQEIVIPSLTWYQKTLHQRDMDVYKLGGELDKLEIEKQKLVEQIRTMEYNASVRQGLNSFQEDKEVATLLQRLQETEAQLAALQASGVGVDVSEYEKAIKERDDYIADVTEKYEALQNAYNELAATLEETPATNTVSSEELAAKDAIIQSNQALIKGKDTEIARLKAELAKAQNVEPVVIDNSAELAEKDTIIAQLQTNVSELTNQYNTLVEQYKELEVQLASTAGVSEQLVALQSQLSTAETRVSELATANAALESAKTALEATNAELLNRPIPEDQSATVEALNQHIQAITGQYNTLLDQYTTLEAQLATANAAIETASAQPAVDNSAELAEKDAIIQQYVAHIETITEQYNAVVAQYEALQMQAVAGSGENEGANSAEVQQLYAHIETITNQYNTLLSAYNELSEGTAQSPNNAELGKLKVELEAAKAEIVRLQELLDEYENEEETEDDERPLPPIPLATEKKQVSLPPQFSNLPPGIRPDDLV